MKYHDKRVWLHTNGDVDSVGYDTGVGLYRVAWKPYFGSPFVGYGRSTSEAYEEVFDALKKMLFLACS